MRIDRTPSINHYQKQNAQAKNTETKNTETKNININKDIKLELEMGEKFETSILTDKFQAYDLISLKKLENESEDIYARLENMVEKMIEEQEEAIELLNRGGKSQVDKALLATVKESISPQGKLGSEFMSERLVEFVKTASGQEKAKIDVLVKAIDEAFKEGEKLLGTLPEVSEETYDRIIEKLDKFIYTQLFKKDPENTKTQLKEMVKEILADQYKSQEIKTTTTALSLRAEAQELALIEDIARDKAIVEKMGKLLNSSLQGDEIIDEDVSPKEALVKGQSIITKEGKFNEVLLKGDSSIDKELNLLEKALTIDKESVIKGFHLQNKSLDVETMSERIVGFVKLASQGDMERVRLFRNEIIEIFKETEKNLGKLPELSQRTYNRIMAGLILVERDLQATRYPRPSIFAEAMNFYRLFRRDSKIRIRTYIFTFLVWMTIYYTFKYWW